MIADQARGQALSGLAGDVQLTQALAPRGSLPETQRPTDSTGKARGKALNSHAGDLQLVQGTVRHLPRSSAGGLAVQYCMQR